jgi:hypothetical protein
MVQVQISDDNWEVMRSRASQEEREVTKQYNIRLAKKVGSLIMPSMRIARINSMSIFSIFFSSY